MDFVVVIRFEAYAIARSNKHFGETCLNLSRENVMFISNSQYMTNPMMLIQFFMLLFTFGNSLKRECWCFKNSYDVNMAP